MNKLIKALIWSYAILILLEGALRKWFLPGSSEILLIIRDPIVLLIYGIAIIEGAFPFNKFMIAIGVLALASVGTSILGGCSNFIIIAYGLRIDYLHLPLIWIIGEQFTRKDVHRLGLAFLILAIPITLLMIQQFRSGPFDWINKGVGSDEGGQIYGAEGRIRPPGPFAFITGPQIYFPLCTAFLLSQISIQMKYKMPIFIASGCAILIALPVSISRTVMLATAIVGLVYLISIFLTKGAISRAFKPILVLGIIAVIALQLPIFDDAFHVFGTRWTEAAASSEGNGWTDVMGRALQTFTNPLDYAMSAPMFGQGIGMGSNVAARLTQGSVGFMLAEEEYAKIYMELGFTVGSGFIMLRISLFLYLLIIAWEAIRQDQNIAPMLILSSISTVVIFGQWAPPTVLGFAVLGSGLVIASCKPEEDALDNTENPPPIGPELDAEEESSPHLNHRLPANKRHPTR